MSPQLAAFFAWVRRFPFASICAGLTIVLGAAAWWFSQDIGEQEIARQERAKEGEAMLDLLVGGSTQRQELATAHEAARRIDENLIVDDLADNNAYFYKIERQTKCRLVALHPGSAATTDGATLYQRIPYTVRLSGAYEQVTAYLLALETGPRLTNITSVNFSRRDLNSPTLNLE